jgi:hypothetical protein
MRFPFARHHEHARRKVTRRRLSRDHECLAGAGAGLPGGHSERPGSREHVAGALLDLDRTLDHRAVETHRAQTCALSRLVRTGPQAPPMAARTTQVCGCHSVNYFTFTRRLHTSRVVHGVLASRRSYMSNDS